MAKLGLFSEFINSLRQQNPSISGALNTNNNDINNNNSNRTDSSRSNTVTISNSPETHRPRKRTRHTAQQRSTPPEPPNVVVIDSDSESDSVLPVAVIPRVNSPPNNANVIDLTETDEHDVAVAPPPKKPHPSPSSELAKAEQELKALRSQLECKICMDAKTNVIFIPCKHYVCCSECSRRLTRCPICRTKIRQKITVYPS
eukprot:GCRY01004222.1.p1 GENE.GCRY01004222.1~~GCRY01004222.1.p1  ORF type:complete len:201 (-),score=1.71 GCRY01004222.1:27-629(-)